MLLCSAVSTVDLGRCALLFPLLTSLVGVPVLLVVLFLFVMALLVDRSQV